MCATLAAGAEDWVALEMLSLRKTGPEVRILFSALEVAELATFSHFMSTCLTVVPHMWTTIRALFGV
jgi:hypothetical protein